MEQFRYLPCPVKLVTDLDSQITTDWDAVCIVDANTLNNVSDTFSAMRAHDTAFDRELTCLWDKNLNSRLIYSPVGDLGDYDDVRSYLKAAEKGIERAIKAGSKSPIIVLPENSKFQYAPLVTLLGALKMLYVPFELRRDVPEKALRVTSLGVYMKNQKMLNEIFEIALTYERGLFIARDIGIGDPEVMSPLGVVNYITEAFPSGTPIKINIVSDVATLTKEFPLFQAVNRAADSVPRHRGKIIFMEYKPPNPKKTIMLVGKGVTYDTGGADVKAGGHMAGMSRDKCGAAAIAGFMRVIGETQPKDVAVYAALCMVRNSIGEECYVADEIITSRAGARVRIGNTDAEGRMSVSDSVALFKEKAINEKLPDPHIFTVCTLTGHAIIAYGEGYSICVDNGPARASGHSERLKRISEEIGDPFEVSILRKEDFEFHRGKLYGDDLIQCNNYPSSQTQRGHMTPAAFIIMASGLDKNGLDSENPIKFSHIDMAASAGNMEELPTGSPLLAFAKTFLE